MQKKQVYISFVITVATLIVAWFVVQRDTVVPTDEPIQATTTATTTDIFDQPPIIPEAKVSTEGWKTCRNEEYGYEFQFPPEWHIYGEDAREDQAFVRESEECNGVSVIVASYDLTQYYGGQPTKPSISVTVNNLGDMNNMYPDTLREWYNITQGATPHKSSNHENIKYLLYSINNTYGLVQINAQPEVQIPSETWRVFMYFGNRVYVMNLPGKSQSDMYEQNDTILSTFHFLATTASTTTS